MDFSAILDAVLLLFDEMVLISSGILEFFTTPIRDYLPYIVKQFPDSLSWVGIILKVALDFMPNVTFLSFMLGGGLVVYLGYQFIVWLLNLIT